MSSTILTPQEILEALHAGIPLIAPRAGGKRLTLSVAYYLQQLISLEKEHGKTIACLLQHVDEDAWIPVSKQLPDDKDKPSGHGLCVVLITRLRNDIKTVDMSIFFKGEFYDCVSGNPIQPIAWQSLPKPYQGGE